MRCTNPECRKTHALIPDFSVPGCSIGTAELNLFIAKRVAGATIHEAGDDFIKAGMSPDYPKDLHRRLKARCRNLLAFVFDLYTLFAGEIPYEYAALIIALAQKLTDNASEAGNAVMTHSVSEPVSVVNAACRQYRCNPVFFSRCTILQFLQNTAKNKFSHNTASKRRIHAPDDFP